MTMASVIRPNTKNDKGLEDVDTDTEKGEADGEDEDNEDVVMDNDPRDASNVSEGSDSDNWSDLEEMEPDRDYEHYDIWSRTETIRKSRRRLLQQRTDCQPYESSLLNISHAIWMAPSAFDLDLNGPMHLTHLLLSPKNWPSLKTQDDRFKVAICKN
ncbi:hypothetical protein VKT23_019177 [Stygiomarasmius scandens]|uniref:Uncharacterized protein n=1 Tax=Marasmiellus scandens TaxID=2682957 RepID=A0ABR1IRA2_9AGAR